MGFVGTRPAFNVYAPLSSTSVFVIAGADFFLGGMMCCGNGVFVDDERLGNLGKSRPRNRAVTWLLGVLSKMKAIESTRATTLYSLT